MIKPMGEGSIAGPMTHLGQSSAFLDRRRIGAETGNSNVLGQ